MRIFHEPVSLHAQHVEVDVPALRGVGAQGEAQRVRVALGVPVREFLLLGPRLMPSSFFVVRGPDLLADGMILKTRVKWPYILACNHSFP